MKKLLLLMFVLFSINSYAKNKLNSPIKKVAKHKKSKTTAKKDQVNIQIKKPIICRVCCTEIVYSSNGTVGASSTHCSGWLLTSCATAGERACSAALEEATEILNGGN
jgi:hypothetical protein